MQWPQRMAQLALPSGPRQRYIALQRLLRSDRRLARLEQALGHGGAAAVHEAVEREAVVGVGALLEHVERALRGPRPGACSAPVSYSASAHLRCPAACAIASLKATTPAQVSAPCVKRSAPC